MSVITDFLWNKIYLLKWTDFSTSDTGLEGQCTHSEKFEGLKLITHGIKLATK